jgi:hypothetical protein
MSWEAAWVVCQHPDHAKKHAKYDQKDGTQEGWKCRNSKCGYAECKYCGSKKYDRCPKCGAV